MHRMKRAGGFFYYYEVMHTPHKMHTDIGHARSHIVPNGARLGEPLKPQGTDRPLGGFERVGPITNDYIKVDYESK